MITRREIYLDSNATHPILPSVRKGLSEALLSGDGALGNPSSIHRHGQKAKKSVAELRDALCQFVGRGDGDEFILLSGATEAINLAMRGFTADRAAEGRKTFILTSEVEHSAILDTVNCLAVPHKILGVDRHGQLNNTEALATVQEAITSDFDVLICLQLCNNETGVAFELDELFSQIQTQFAPKPMTHMHKIKGGRYPMTPQRVWILVDAAQALGKLDMSRVRRAFHYADYAAISGHKLGGPAGIGCLWLRSHSPFKVQMTGGMQEKKRRAGTLNSLGALGFKMALQDWQKNGETYRQRWTQLRKLMVEELLKVEGLVLHGMSPEGELPALSNTLNFHVEGCPEESLLMALDLDGFCVSSGSACNSGSLKPSHVLSALGYTREQALTSVRVCMGVETTEDEILAFTQSVREKTEQIRQARIKSAEMLLDIHPA